MSKLIKKKDLAAILSDETNGDYFSYEMQDMLDVFCRTIERLVKEGNTVELLNFGKFRPKVNKSKKMKTVYGYDVVTKPSITLEFNASETLQKRMKVASREALDKFEKENS